MVHWTRLTYIHPDWRTCLEGQRLYYQSYKPLHVKLLLIASWIWHIAQVGFVQQVPIWLQCEEVYRVAICLYNLCTYIYQEYHIFCFQFLIHKRGPKSFKTDISPVYLFYYFIFSFVFKFYLNLLYTDNYQMLMMI